MEGTQTLTTLSQSEKSRFISRTYGWMALALFISAASAFATASSPVLLKLIFGHGILGWAVLAIAEIGLVIWLSSSIRKISVAAATIGFIAYAVLNGMTLSSIFFVYQIDSIAMAFFTTAILFTVMSLYGARTQRDLTSLGRYLLMGLLGVIIASVVGGVISLITKTPLNMLNILISVATVVIFTGLTAYDSQKILKTAQYANGNADYKKVSIIAALELYLDFINLLLALLRLFGKKR
ncbi:MAG: Bax inhibitor-1/YccA family protein [Treponema sp.]|nr:Bax inhibitor-1/YccA family protein [Treponema sp.]